MVATARVPGIVLAGTGREVAERAGSGRWGRWRVRSRHGRTGGAVVGASAVLARRRGALRHRHLSRGMGAVPDADQAVSPRAQCGHHADADPTRRRRAAALAVRGGAQVRGDARASSAPGRDGSAAGRRGVPSARRWPSRRRARPAGSSPRASAPRPRPQALCPKTPALPAGEPFLSVCAPRPASAVEAKLRADLFARLGVTEGLNAVRVGRPFFDHLEVWPDILLPELRIAVEYDSTGTVRARARRQAGGCRSAQGPRAPFRGLGGRAHPNGQAREARTPRPAALQRDAKGLDRLLDVFRDIRGPLLIDAYLR